MPQFTQKYTIVRLLKELPDGFEFSMKDWPVHVTLADVFAIEQSYENVLEELKMQLTGRVDISSEVIGEDWFGQDRSVHVKLLDKTAELARLHETIVDVLDSGGVKFNTPEYTRDGFKPHSSVQQSGQLNKGDVVVFDRITLIDMFPNENPFQRRILGTIYFS